MFRFDENIFVPFLVFAIPIVAIVGGITAGIVRSLGQQPLAELAAPERLAAIERGIPPSQLPPPLSLGHSGWYARRGPDPHPPPPGPLLRGARAPPRRHC